MKKYASTMAGPMHRQSRPRYVKADERIHNLMQFVANYKAVTAKQFTENLLGFLGELQTLDPEKAEHCRIDIMALLQEALDKLSTMVPEPELPPAPEPASKPKPKTPKKGPRKKVVDGSSTKD